MSDCLVAEIDGGLMSVRIEGGGVVFRSESSDADGPAIEISMSFASVELLAQELLRVVRTAERAGNV